jgi:hypothetical protein
MGTPPEILREVQVDDGSREPFDMVILVFAGGGGVLLILLAMFLMFWSVFVLIGGPDPDPSRAEQYRGYAFIGFALAVIPWALATLQLCAALRSLNRLRSGAVEFWDLLGYVAMVAGGVTLAFPSPFLVFIMLAYHGGIQGPIFGVSFAVILVALVVFGIFLCVLGSIRIGQCNDAARRWRASVYPESVSNT